MNRNHLTYRWLLVTGSLFMLLGLAHLLIAVPMGMEAVKSLPSAEAQPLTLANIVTALAVMLSGLLTIFCASSFRYAEAWTWIIALSVGIFMTVVGLGYVVVTPDNPFAYLALMVALFNLIPLFLYRRQIQLA